MAYSGRGFLLTTEFRILEPESADLTSAEDTAKLRIYRHEPRLWDIVFGMIFFCPDCLRKCE